MDTKDTKNDPWVIEYSFFHEAFGVRRLQDSVARARDNYMKQRLHPYVILGSYESEEECQCECAVLKSHRNEHPLSAEHRMKEFQEAVEGLREHSEVMNVDLYQKLKEVATTGQLTHYSDIAPIVGRDMAQPGDRNKISVLLDEISTHEHRNERPLLSAVVVRRQDHVPGGGFFQMAQRVGVFNGGDRIAFFEEELSRVHDFWKQHGSR